ncbi:MAG: type II secretion system F family protein [Proteobacteria bacterium]|nr:type II secretion system F family protein [Pseudomonadota bacterium]
MRCYYHRLLLQSGKTQRGISKLLMENERSAQVFLEKQRDAIILKLVTLPGWFLYIYDFWSRIRGNYIDKASLAEFFHNISVMLKAGVPIFTAVEEMTSEDSDIKVRELAQNLLESMRSGQTFSQSLDKHADTIPKTARYLAYIGETSGNQDRTLHDAAEHLNRIVSITRDTKRAMIYPAFVFTSIIGATLFWLYYVVPSISDLFKQMQVDLPTITKVTVAFSNHIHNYFFVYLIVVFIIIVVLISLYKYRQSFRYKVHKLFMKLPISRTIMKSSGLAFITEYLSLLISSGVEIITSLEIIEASISNEVYREKIGQVRKGVMRGNTLTDELRLAKVFPSFVLRLTSIGEQTGTLDKQLRYLAEEYRKRFEHTVASISEIIQPLVIIFAGLLFILMIVALFLPVYKLIGEVGILRGG